jgi:pimeloyl-ACP methyl ester carboxylesterase
VLVCPPFGQEAIRSYRMLRVLADRLARAGCDVLRFDYLGTGDSMGDDAEATLSGFVDDILLADAELEALSDARAAVWLGARLGATAAWLASERSSRSPDRLVLCEPVLDGPAYLAALARAHEANQAASYSLGAWRPPATPGDDVDDAVGFPMGRGLRDELGGLALRPSRHAPRAAVTIVRTAEGEATQDWPGARTIEVPVPFDWTSEEAINAALVPASLVQALISAVGPDA